MFYKAVIPEFQTEDGKKITQGKGVDEAPYLVYTPGQLDDVRNYLSASFLQLRDIDLANPAIDNFDSARGWLPIGSWDNSTNSGNSFVGHYDGNYRKITGFYIERPDENCVGLFGFVAGYCYVKNMIIEGTSITGKHFDRIFTDDIINVQDRISRAERERIKIVYQELQNIRNRGGRIFNTLTPWHKDDASSLMPSPKIFDCYSTGLMTAEQIQQKKDSMS